MDLKKISLVLLVTLIVSCSKDEKLEEEKVSISVTNDTSLAYKGIKGKVKTIVEENYYGVILKDGKMDDESGFSKMEKKEYRYNKRGLLVKELEGSGYGQEDYYLSYEYDSFGNCNRINKIDIVNTYDKMGRLIESKSPDRIKKYSYANGKVVQMKRYGIIDDKLYLSRTYSYKYNDKGRVVEKVFTSHDEEGNIRENVTLTYQYNERGLLVKELTLYCPEDLCPVEYTYKDFDYYGNPKVKISKLDYSGVENYFYYTYTELSYTYY